jgi:prenyltransferase beta subunit
MRENTTETTMRLSLIAALAVLQFCAQADAAPQSKDKKDEVKMPDNARKSTARGLAWLAKQQNSDGSWSEARYPHNPAITAFALLAFLSQGHVPDQGTYGKELARGLRFLLSCSREDGYLIGTRGGNMYSHAMAALALAELWGVTQDKKIKPVLQKAIDLIVSSQNRQGGWRYSPRPVDADISVTIMQVMALRAAKNAGIHVKDETMKNAIAYIKTCYDENTGGFTYQPRNRRPGFARTAAGVCVLQLTGEYKAREIPRAIEFLKDNFDAREHYWYGHYYASHAMHQIGGKEWKEWYARMVDTFLDFQRSDGSWWGKDRNSAGPVYDTSIAVIALAVPMNYLPIFQR